jgi:YD repeat-containing protein
MSKRTWFWQILALGALCLIGDSASACTERILDPTTGAVVREMEVNCTNDMYVSYQPGATIYIDGVAYSEANIGWDDTYTDDEVAPPAPPDSGIVPLFPKTDNSELPTCKSQDGKPDPTSPSPSTGHPVIIATGEKYLEQRDFATNSIQRLSLDRTYRAFQTSGVLFGAHWKSPFDFPTMNYNLANCSVLYNNTCYPSSVTVRLPDGTTQEYDWYTSGGSGTSSQQYYPAAYYFPAGTTNGAGSLGYARGTPAGFSLIFEGREYAFDRDSQTLREVRDARSSRYATWPLLYTLTYNNGYLMQVATPSGNAISFSYGSEPVGGRALVDTATAPDGRQWRYTYDANRNLQTVTPSSNVGVVTYHYEDPNDPSLLTGYSLDGVRVTRYSYDANRRVTKSGYENNEEFETFEYQDLTTIVRNAKGSESHYKFEAYGQGKRLVGTEGEITASCPLQTASMIGYDYNGNIKYTVDRNQNVTTFQYDDRGRLIWKTTATGTSNALTEMDYWDDGMYSSDTVLRSRVYVNASGQSVLREDYTYYEDVASGGPLHLMLQSVTTTDLLTSVARTTSYSYTFHPNGSLATMTTSSSLPSGTADTIVSYDANGFLISTKNAVGHETTFSEQDGMGRPGRIVDPNGTATTLTYDMNGNVKTSITAYPEGLYTIGYDYDNANRMTAAHYPNGSGTTWKFNTAGRLIESGNAQGEVITRSLDMASNTYSTSSSRSVPVFNGTTITASAASPFTTTLQTDSEGRPWIKTGNNGQRVQYAYDADGNLKTVTDAANHVIQYTYDEQNRVRTVTSPDNGVVRYDYDANGNLQYVTDQRQLRTEYRYDGFGDRTAVISPDTGTTSYAYDVGGRMISETRSDGKVIEYSWDAINRMVARTSGGVTQSYNYDEGMYGVGHLTSFIDATGSTSFRYSAAGRLLQQTNTIYGRVFNTSWAYDSAQRLQTMTYPTGLVLNYSYDSYGRLTGVRRGTTGQ